MCLLQHAVCAWQSTGLAQARKQVHQLGSRSLHLLVQLMSLLLTPSMPNDKLARHAA